MMELEHVAIPELPDNERVFKNQRGKCCRIKITKGLRNPQPFEIATEPYLAVKVEACYCDETGQAISDEDGHPLIDTKVESIPASCLAAGTHTVEGEVARASLEACQRLFNLVAQYEAWKRLP